MDPITAELSRNGVWLVGLNVLLQQLGLPIPAVPTMMLAGALAMTAQFDIVSAFAIAVAASVVADLVWFWAGRRFGYPVLRLLCRVSLSPDTCVRQTEGIFERWGFYSVVVSKFVPGFSTVAPPIAGALRMRVGSFALASLASAALWAGAAMITGALFARQIDRLLAWMAAHVATAALVGATAVAVYALVKLAQRVRMTRLLAAAMISVSELRDRIDSDERPFVIDVGSSLANARPHIPGAVMLDLDAIARLDDFPDDREIVVYCSCPNEVSARRAAQILLQKGYRRVRPLAGGIDAWVKAGYPVEEGSPVRLPKRPAVLEAA
ncbi:MAG TPA: DedA family protein/thiosulfate sulfurtransferase GlpE [Casimicrobiaceae bacterium]|jgi:membrane protein DedA with SNARE-associated domain/rhodanese-related sulfurtransferase|nr:DedA family protein/thiosulfate sulfurtransferase GlpE [Casimicrobiaceae bacterium]